MFVYRRWPWQYLCHGIILAGIDDVSAFNFGRALGRVVSSPSEKYHCLGLPVFAIACRRVEYP